MDRKAKAVDRGNIKDQKCSTEEPNLRAKTKTKKQDETWTGYGLNQNSPIPEGQKCKNKERDQTISKILKETRTRPGRERRRPNSTHDQK